MGLMDAFRGKRKHDDDDESNGPGGLEDAAGGDAAPDPMFFTPRTDGIYVGAGEILRFAPGGRVILTPEDSSGSALGDYTPGGRFMVQRQFERPVFYAALEFSFERFRARRTDTGSRVTAEQEYVYEPDGTTTSTESDVASGGAEPDTSSSDSVD
jgi:hypothetical protein